MVLGRYSILGYLDLLGLDPSGPGLSLSNYRDDFQVYLKYIIL